MLKSKKNKSVLPMLRDRELNIKFAPYVTGLKIASQLIRSDRESLYSNTWTKHSKKQIAYESGNLYFSNYKQFCSINATNNKRPPLYNVEHPSDRKRVSDVISYSGKSVCKDIEDICQCQTERCLCLSQFLFSISNDNWLCQHSTANGKLLRKIYVNLYKQKIKFKYCDWDVYGERFFLVTCQNPYNLRTSREKSDIVDLIAVFTTFPIDFLALMEIKRSVFGPNVTAISILNQLLYIGQGSNYVNIYSFEDFLKEGTLTPYKLGDPYENEGKIGYYPIGLPLNFAYSTAPPILFRVQCLGQVVRFGGYPYHYITVHNTNPSQFRVASVATDTPIDIAKAMKLDFKYNLVNNVVFHPDQSNRIMFKKDYSIDLYQIIAEKDRTPRLSEELYSMHLSPTKKNDEASAPCYNKILTPLMTTSIPSIILCSKYDDELKIFAVLAKYNSQDVCSAFVLLYDSLTGEKLRTVFLKGAFCDSKMYELYIDLFAFIIIERDDLTDFTVHVYAM